MFGTTEENKVQKNESAKQGQKNKRRKIKRWEWKQSGTIVWSQYDLTGW